MTARDRAELEKIAGRRWAGPPRAYFTSEQAAQRRLERLAALVQLDPAAAGSTYRDVNYQWRYSISQAAIDAARALLAT